MADTFTQKAALAAGAVAAVSVPVTADAVVLYRSNSPVSISLGGGPSSVGWDVDGTGGPDFMLNATTTSVRIPHSGVVSVTYFGGVNIGIVSERQTMRERIYLDSVSGAGAGIIGPVAGGPQVRALHSSFNIGPTLNAYAWGSASESERGVLFRSTQRRLVFVDHLASSTQSTAQFGEGDFATADGFTRSGENVIGFRFDRGLSTDLNYGWAKVEWDLSTPGQESFTITEWAWEGEPGKPIHAVPTPAAAVSGLTLLAMGAAGIRRQRQRNRKALATSNE